MWMFYGKFADKGDNPANEKLFCCLLLNKTFKFLNFVA